MDGVKHGLTLVCYGIRDCFCGFLLLKNLVFTKDSDTHHREKPKKSVFETLIQCFLFGFLFIASDSVFNRYILNDALTVFVTYMGEEMQSVAWLQSFLYFIFCIIYILPLLILSKLLNFSWYQDIADLTFKKTGVKKKANMVISEFYADQIKSFIVQVLYYVQAYIVYLLPLPSAIHMMWYLFHLSLLSSLYAFEYKWVYIGLPLSQRLLKIAKKWPYFLGFGLPLAIASTFVSSNVDSMIIFSSLFPILVISSSNTFDEHSSIYNHPFHTFKIVDSLSDSFVSSLLKRLLGVKNI